MHTRNRATKAAIAAFGMAVGAAVLGAARDARAATDGQHGMQASQTRQAEVARKGATVMPFDLTRTTHFFDDLKTGGVETVSANDKTDSGQIRLVRAHLSAEAKRFSHGDFSDPAKIHGENMPGLAELSHAGAKLRVKYKSLPAGASLTYSSRDEVVVAAIHEWFAAQRSDHMAHMHMHDDGSM